MSFNTFPFYGDIELLLILFSNAQKYFSNSGRAWFYAHKLRIFLLKEVWIVLYKTNFQHRIF